MRHSSMQSAAPVPKQPRNLPLSKSPKALDTQGGSIRTDHFTGPVAVRALLMPPFSLRDLNSKED
jgi:hypothetical protein